MGTAVEILLALGSVVLALYLAGHSGRRWRNATRTWNSRWGVWTARRR